MCDSLSKPLGNGFAYETSYGALFFLRLWRFYGASTGLLGWMLVPVLFWLNLLVNKNCLVCSH